METNNEELGMELVKDLLENTTNSLDDEVSLDNAGEGDTVVVTQDALKKESGASNNMRIKEQTWMTKHDRASSIQVAGTEMGEKRNNSSKVNPVAD